MDTISATAYSGLAQRQAWSHRQTADRLLSALRGDEFVLFSQPIVAADPESLRASHREILVRFLEEEEKLLPPGSFFPVLEEFRLMTYLDRWVINRTIRWLRRQAGACPGSRCAINLAPDTLLDRAFPAFVLKQIETGGVSGATLSFEVSWADAIAHRERLRALAAQLRPAGIAFALASYAGEAGLAETIGELAPGFLKISADLVNRMHRDPMDAAMVEGIGARCRGQGIVTIAEHVESERTRELVAGAGIDFVQGFLVGKPGPLR